MTISTDQLMHSVIMFRVGQPSCLFSLAQGILDILVQRIEQLFMFGLTYRVPCPYLLLQRHDSSSTEILCDLSKPWVVRADTIFDASGILFLYHSCRPPFILTEAPHPSQATRSPYHDHGGFGRSAYDSIRCVLGAR